MRFRFSGLDALREGVGHRLRLVVAVGLSATPVIVTSVWWPAATTGTATAISMSWISGAAAFDRLWGRLPDALLALAFLPIAMAIAVHSLQGSSSALSGFAYGAAVWSSPLLVVHLVVPSALGFGDVKAAAVLGAALGLTLEAFAVAFALVVALAAASAAGVVTRRQTIALGPFLVIGALTSLLFGRFVGEVS